MTYNKSKYMKEWRAKNREHILKYKKEYRLSHKEQINEYKKRNIEKIRLQKKKHDANYHQKNRDKLLPKIRERSKKYYQNNRQKVLEYGKKHRQLSHVKERRLELERIRRKNNPRSNRSFSYDLQDAMNNVRIRDRNTCQWQGCNLTFKEVPIHVHHIFPRNEYPLLELIEQYMICYCANHHGLFHRMRGDHYSEMISPRYQENESISITSTRGGE